MTRTDSDSPPSSFSLDRCPRGVDFRIRELRPQSRFGDQDAQVTLRLRELGFLPGARLRVIGIGFLGGDPLAVQINGSKFALRHAEAEKILVERSEAHS